MGKGVVANFREIEGVGRKFSFVPPNFITLPTLLGGGHLIAVAYYDLYSVEVIPQLNVKLYPLTMQGGAKID